MRLHYAKTLAAWRDAFEANKSQLSEIYDERFIRLWRFYLLACENYFAHGCGMVFQIQLTHRQDAAVPLTRAYIAEKKLNLQTVYVRPPFLENKTLAQLTHQEWGNLM